MKNNTTLLLILLTWWCGNGAYAQAPTDNPYATHYRVKGNWTDSLPWKKVTDVTLVNGLVNAEGRVDSLLLQQTMAGIAGKGGGVLYFPAGTYYLDYQLNMASHVILRGATPRNVVDAKRKGYAPPTRFEFPRYKPSRQGTGTPNESAFKRIFADTSGLEKFGLVNIDVNRAAIGFYGGDYHLNVTSNGKTMVPRNYHKDVLLFGVRQNNAAVLHPAVPTKIQTDEGQGWQRWPYQYGSNIDVIASRNCIVANCRLNDEITDDFDQAEYIVDDGFRFSDAESRFRYTNHAGISVNSIKTDLADRREAPGLWNTYSAYGYLNTEDPAAEPFYGATGIRITDNFVRTSYSPVAANGIDKVIAGNITEMAAKSDTIEANGFNTSASAWDSKLYFERHTYVNPAGDTLPYRLMKPAKVEPGKVYPLVVFFHGLDEHGNDNEKQLRRFVSLFTQPDNLQQFPCYVLVPQAPVGKEFGRSLDSVPSWPLQSTLDVMQRLQKSQQMDQKRIYAMGISSGGSAAWEVILRHPKMFAAAVPMVSLRSLGPDEARKIRDVPIWVITGAKDKSIPTPFVKVMMNKIKDAGGNPRHTDYPNESHYAWVRAYKDKLFLPWVFAQKR